MTTRKFNFVLSVADEQKANDVVNASLYPVTTSDEEKARIARESVGLQLGHGEFHITHSHVTLGKGDRPDSIDVLKFDVTINFSPGLTLAQVLAPKPTGIALIRAGRNCRSPHELERRPGFRRSDCHASTILRCSRERCGETRICPSRTNRS